MANYYCALGIDKSVLCFAVAPYTLLIIKMHTFASYAQCKTKGFPVSVCVCVNECECGLAGQETLAREFPTNRLAAVGLPENQCSTTQGIRGCRLSWLCQPVTTKQGCVDAVKLV